MRRVISLLLAAILMFGLLAGCHTGAVADGCNLPSVAVSRGATTAIGFVEEIPCDRANKWTVKFFRMLQQGYNVLSACENLSDQYSGLGLDTCVIYGNPYTMLNEEV